MLDSGCSVPVTCTVRDREIEGSIPSTPTKNENHYGVKAMLILASASAGRKMLLEKLGLTFTVIPAHLDEEKYQDPDPLQLVQKIAKAKALAVLKILGVREGALNAYLIIAADSMVAFRGKTYGKPKAKSEAKKLLRLLAGQTHEFITGVYIFNTKSKKTYQKAVKTTVIFRQFTQKWINEYVQTAAVTTHAGGYSTDDAMMKEKFELIGSETNVVGLPLEVLLPILKKEKIIFKDSIFKNFFRREH